MSYTATASDTYTYTTADIETVVRRFTADIVMIAQSSGAITEAKARDYAHDVEALAKKGYLKKGRPDAAERHDRGPSHPVYRQHGGRRPLTMSRPGGVLWR